MKNLSINLLKLCLVWAITVFLVASCTKPSYANSVHPHGELALVGYEYLVHIPHFQAVFLCMLSASLRFMVMMYFNDAYIDHGIFKVNIRIYYRKIVSNPPALAQALSLSK